MAHAWPARPSVGAEVQLINGSDRWVIVRYEGDLAIVRTHTGKVYDVSWRNLKPWRLH